MLKRLAPRLTTTLQTGRTGITLTLACVSAALSIGLSAHAVAANVAVAVDQGQGQGARGVQSAGAAALPAGWVSSWSMAAQQVPPAEFAPSFNRAPDTAGRTVRQIVVPSFSGASLRIRLTNRFGTAPLDLRSINVAVSERGSQVVAGTGKPVTFAGRPNVVIPPGEERWSDPVAQAVVAGQPLSVSFVAPGVPATTWHKIASQVSYISMPGDFAANTDGAPFRVRTTAYLWLDGLAVEAPGARGVVAIGDSITDGMRSTLNANRRWPDQLAARLAREGGASKLAVVNLGISGNRLLHDSPCYGEALEKRFRSDALGQPGVRDVIVLIGINDINFGSMAPHSGLDCDVPHVRVQAADVIDGYRRLIAAAHQQHVRIYGATLTPAGLTDDRERVRTEINTWIRTSHAFDGVVDFEAALRDPADPRRLLPKFDSNDHIHPSDAGYARMAEAVPLEMLGAQ
jgi:lysophospholipase L1-like esterase